ncbi:hypothetical protein [Microbulbifer discodermiae]|uniref:hypothetical protein n=1 Tax=Microbulbifer sp. 2201CG32-9 TaxID=3232309 RepID=UPI00345BAF16
MLDSEDTERNALDNALSEIMGEVEEPKGQPEAETADEEESQPEADTETEEEVESEDSEEEQTEDDADTEEEESENTEDDESGTELSDGATLNIDGEEVSVKQVKAWRDAEKNFQVGYTKKYQKLAETQKSADSKLEQSEQILGFLEAQLKAPLQQFQGIDWQALQVSDPAKYQALQGQFQQAMTSHRQVEQAVKQLQDKAKEQRDSEFQRKAQEAVATLKEMHADWSNTLYHQVLDYAVESGVPREEIAQEVRPWVISALLANMRSAKAQKVKAEPKPQSVKRTIKQKAASKPRTQAQKRADQLKRDRTLAAKGDRSAQNRVIAAEVDAQLGL